MKGTRTLALALTTFSAGASDTVNRQAAACENSLPSVIPYRVTIAGSLDSSFVVSDGGGYFHDRSSCMAVADEPRGFFHLAHPNAPQWPDCRNRMSRSFKLNFDHPVPGGGGTRRGVITDSRPHLQVVARLDSAGKPIGLGGMAVGESVKARYISFSATDHQLRIYFNPTYTTCPDFMKLAKGSTHGTITRTSATHWEIDLPSGSIGRLLEGPEGGNRQDRGLYYFRARLLVDSQ